jgi:hypothetical protein
MAWLDKHGNTIVPGMFVRHKTTHIPFPDYYLIAQDSDNKLFVYPVTPTPHYIQYFCTTANLDIEIINPDTLIIPEWMHQYMGFGLEYELSTGTLP